mgnify:CR=1 FL=1
MWSHIPPNLGRIFDEAGCNQHPDVSIVLSITVDLFEKAGARHFVEYADAVRFEPRIQNGDDVLSAKTWSKK